MLVFVLSNDNFNFVFLVCLRKHHWLECCEIDDATEAKVDGVERMNVTEIEWKLRQWLRDEESGPTGHVRRLCNA